MKRHTVYIFDSLLLAIRLRNFLNNHGFHAKIVSKHAVQIEPDEKAKLDRVHLYGG